MKPNFALTLSFEGISLLQRAFPGWTVLGEVSLASPDVTRDLAALRAKAKGALRTKLVLPDDQIKYITLPAPDGDPEAAARSALTGATPYAVDDLAYDFAIHGGQMHIAAVARETLAEAEAFAAEHGFTPVCFVAMPEDGAYTGEPFFGATAQARGLLAPGETIDRDSAPIRITGAAAMAQSAPGPAPEAKPEPVPETAPQTPNKASEPAQAEPKPQVGPADEAAQAADEAATDSKPDPKPQPEPDPTAEPTPPVEMPSGFASMRASRGDASTGPVPKLTGASRLSTVDGADITRPAPAAERTDPERTDPKRTDPEHADPERTDPKQADPEHAVAPGTGGGRDIPPLPSPGAPPTLDTPAIAAAAASLIPDPDARLAPPEPAPQSAPPKTGAHFFSRRQPKDAPRASSPADAAQKDAQRSSREREKQRMTVFGARGNEVGGKPRFLGLILTAVLLLFLVGVAAWASVFLDDGLARIFGGPKDIKISEVSPEDEIAEQAVTPLPGAQDAGETELAALAPAPDAIAPLPAITPLPDLPAALSPSEALARYAATGIWQMAPDPPRGDGPAVDTNEVFETATDPDLRILDVARLDPPPAREVALTAQINPPPAGVLFDFDARGFIRAVEGGVVSPGGVRILAGRPALLPPEGFFARLPAAAPPQEPVTEAALTPKPQSAPAPEAATDAEQSAQPAPADPAIPDAATTFEADPALAGLRPRARPEGLAPEAAEEEAIIAPEVATPEADTALASLRPRLRPATVTAAATSAPDASAATLRSDDGAATPLIDSAALNRALTEAATAETQAGALDPSLFDAPTAQAVSASLIPLTRPNDFATTVERSREETAATPVAAAQVLTPSIPSRASVARQATQKNAINLRKVNLIGVYGAPNNRRALVRLGNGRYQKVKVGDRLDGGQVAAIGDNELRYVKRGRNLTLEMPKG